MKTNEYLYGDAKIDPIPKEIVEQRVTALRIHKDKLLAEDNQVRDWERIKDILDASDLWIALGKGEKK